MCREILRPSQAHLSLLFFLVVLAPLACRGASAPPPTAPSGDHHAHWLYAGEAGPDHWGDLEPGFAVCKTGSSQSPIDLPLSPSGRAAAPARPQWAPVPVRVANNGHSIQVDDTAPSSFIYEGTTYHLAQLHFHVPAEHTVGGHRYAAEMHLVHKSDAGKLLVVAVLFEEGAANAALAPVWSNMPADASSPPAVVAGATVDVSSLLPASPRFLRYDGSLTAPPCTEGVTWLVTVPDPPLQMSPQQLEAFRARTQPTTNRPLQPLAGREVVLLAP